MIKVKLRSKKHAREDAGVDPNGNRITLASDGVFCQFFDEAAPYEDILNFLNTNGSTWGTNQIVLTDADIEKLKSGQMLAWGQEEYATLIYYGEVIDETPTDS